MTNVHFSITNLVFCSRDFRKTYDIPKNYNFFKLQWKFRFYQNSTRARPTDRNVTRFGHAQKLRFSFYLKKEASFSDQQKKRENDPRNSTNKDDRYLN